MKDQRYRILLCGGQVRAMAAQTTQLVEDARRAHNLSAVATAALGRALSMTSLLSLELKNPQDLVSVRIQGGGPLGGIVAVGMADGSVKGYVEHPEVELPPRADGKLDVGGAVGSDGMLTVIRDLGMRDPYTGQVRLQSGEIGDDFAWYYTVSQQQPSLVSVGVMVQPDYSVAAAAALVIQPMPGCPEEVLDQLEGASGQLANLSAQLAARHGDLEGLLCELLGPFEPEIIPAGEPAFRCNCSRERMTRGLIALGAQELTDLIEQDGKALLQCHFCNAQYAFDRDELLAILQQAKNV